MSACLRNSFGVFLKRNPDILTVDLDIRRIDEVLFLYSEMICSRTQYINITTCTRLSASSAVSWTDIFGTKSSFRFRRLFVYDGEMRKCERVMGEREWGIRLLLLYIFEIPIRRKGQSNFQKTLTTSNASIEPKETQQPRFQYAFTRFLHDFYTNFTRFFTVCNS